MVMYKVLQCLDCYGMYTILNVLDYHFLVVYVQRWENVASKTLGN